MRQKSAQKNNKELSRSLYQLNVLYNTSSQFAGTLNTDKLYEVMIEAMEKTLSFDISSALIFSSADKPIFNLNTMYIPSENLITALKIRSVLNYRNATNNSSLPDDKDFNLIETKQSLVNPPNSLRSVISASDLNLASIKID